MEENQVPASTPPQALPTIEDYLTPENLEQLKAQARMQAMQAARVQVSPPGRVVYVRRNLTVAELIVVFVISCGLVLGIQGTWHLANNLPRIEVKWSK